MSAKHIGVATCVSAALLGMSGAISCGQILGVDDYRVAPRLQACGGFQYASDACGQCMARECCTEDEACAVDPGCSGQHGCEAACAPGDTACPGKCRFGRANNAKPYLDAIACQRMKCSAACSWQCGKPTMPAIAPCSACLGARCCDEHRAVWEDAAASSLLVCRVNCTGFEDGCPCTGSGVTLDAVRKLETCTNTTCSDSCPLSLAQPDWRCLPTITWPPRASTTTELDMNFGVFDLGKQPVPNIRVRACLASDLECTTPQDSKHTDDRGWAALSMPSGVTLAAPFFDYIELHDDSGNDSGLSAPRIIDTLYHTNAYVDPINLWWVGVSQAALSVVLPSGTTWVAQSTGIVHVSGTSCGNGSGGVSVDVKDHPELVVYYADVSGLSSTAGTQATPTGGLGVIVGVPPGRPTIEAWVHDTGELVFRRQVVVRAGAWTVVFMQPAPR